MKTTFRARQPYADIFFDCARKAPCVSPAKPTRFMEKMKANQGCIGVINGMGLDEEGLERKNPVICALGDSVTAGHFESLVTIPKETVEALYGKTVHPTADGKTPLLPVEITDARESYVEKFRNMLIDKYECTSVSVINAGLAGDNLIQMSKRAERDVIRYQPDLVLINGSLNWNLEMGTTAQYKTYLTELVERIKQETAADIILLTPNGDLPNTLFGDLNVPIPTTPERVQAIREVAAEQQVCLADVYAVWEAAREAGCPWKELLSNGVNHPGVEGHEVYAMVLMKLFEE